MQTSSAKPIRSIPSKAWLLDITKLQAGDILLSTTSRKSSAAIRKFTKSAYSHAAIVANPPVLVEAMPDTGVRMFNATGMMVKDRDKVRLLRLKNPNPLLAQSADLAY